MFKYILSIFLTAALAFLGGLYLPWWSIAIAAALASIMIPQKPFLSFFSGFISIFLLWEILAWWMDHKNNGILSQKIAHILPLNGSSALLIIITSVLGSLVAGFAAVSGAYLRRWVVDSRKTA